MRHEHESRLMNRTNSHFPTSERSSDQLHLAPADVGIDPYAYVPYIVFIYVFMYMAYGIDIIDIIVCVQKLLDVNCLLTIFSRSRSWTFDRPSHGAFEQQERL